MKSIKIGMVFVISIMMVFSSIGIASASEQAFSPGVNENVITPYWVGLNTIISSFDLLSGGQANPIVRGMTYSGTVDYVNVKVYLKRSSGSSWSTVKSWSQNIPISLNTFAFNETYGLTSNYSYKYSATVKSYKNSVLLDSVSFDSNIIDY